MQVPHPASANCGSAATSISESNAPAPDCASPGPQAYANGTRLQQVCIMRFCETKRRPTAFELPSAACGRNQLEGSCWPRAISRQLSIFIFVISPRNAEKLRRKDLGFFADCAAKKWPFGQPVPPAVCEKAAVSVQPSAISLRSAISFENLSARYDLQVHGSSLKPTMSDCSVASMTDQLSELYQDLLTGSYDCVDRIVLNGNCSVCYSPGGFSVLVAAASRWLGKRTGQCPLDADGRTF